MPDENLQIPQTALQINASQTGQIDLSHNEPDRTPSPDSENSIIKKIREAGGAVIGKWKVGRGRPRKDGQPKKSDVPGGNILHVATPVAPQGLPEGSPMASTPSNSAGDSLLRRSIVSGAKGILAFLKSLVRIKADAAGIDEKFTEKTLSECEPNPEDLENFSESLKLCLEKWNVKSEHAPEISLAINGAKLVAPYALLFSTFNAEIKRRRKLEADEVEK